MELSKRLEAAIAAALKKGDKTLAKEIRLELMKHLRKAKP